MEEVQAVWLGVILAQELELPMRWLGARAAALLRMWGGRKAVWGGRKAVWGVLLALWCVGVGGRVGWGGATEG